MQSISVGSGVNETGRRSVRENRQWAQAFAEHEEVLEEFLTVCRRIDDGGWQRAPAPGKWSPAAVALHVCRAYELGRDAATGGSSMRLLVPRPVAWLSRTLVLPLLIALRRFPQGARAPAEVVPDAAEARRLVPEAAAARLRQVSDEAAVALHRAAREQPALRVAHAYFGTLTPRGSLRLLSAHTRHHARRLV